MKVYTYTAEKDSSVMQQILLWRKDVTKRATKVAIWPMGVAIWPEPSGWGIGYVDLLKGFLRGQVVTKRRYGVIKVVLRLEEQR